MCPSLDFLDAINLEGVSLERIVGQALSGIGTVRGTAADGVARMILLAHGLQPGEFSISIVNPSGGREDIGTLTDRSFRETGTFVRVHTDPIIRAIHHAAQAGYITPTRFARPKTADAQEKERRITLQIVFTPDGGGSQQSWTKDIVIGRPPIALVHGIWSEPATWNKFNLPQFFFAQRIDYREANAKHFAVGATIVGKAIKEMISQYKDNARVAAVQADVVAHSMGGDVVRTAALCGKSFTCGSVFSPYKYKRDDNCQQGDFHKLITIGTPHLGSAFAALFFNNRNTVCQQINCPKFPDTTIRLADIFENQISVCTGLTSRERRKGLNLPINKGAVEDLVDNPPSPALTTLGRESNFLPLHFIVGTASPGDVVVADDLLRSQVSSLCPPFGNILPLPSSGLSALSAIFKGDLNDIIVSATSQRKETHTPSPTVTLEEHKVIHSTELENKTGVDFPSPAELDLPDIRDDVVDILNNPNPAAFEPPLHTCP